MNLNIHRLMITAVLLGGAACSMRSEPGSQEGTAQPVVAAVTASSPGASADPTLPSSAGHAAPRTKAGSTLGRATVTAPPANGTPTPAAPAGFPTATAAASASIATLANVVGLNPSGKRGFASSQEVTSSTLGDGLPVQFVGLSTLAGFAPGQDTKALSIDEHQVLYPIMVAGTVRSSVTVQQGANGKWQAVKFGSASLASSSHAVGLTIAAAHTADAGTLSLLEIPALHVYLLSDTNQGVHMVTPLFDIPGTSYKAGVTQKAADVFAGLRSLAAKVNPNLPS